MGNTQGSNKKENAGFQGTLRMKIQNASTLPMQESVVSEPVWIGFLPWVMSVSPLKKYRHDKAIGVILRCTKDIESTRNGIIPPCNWSCKVWATVKIISHEPGREPWCQKFENVLFSSDSSIRHHFLFKWTPLVELGYLKNDSLIIDIDIKTTFDLQATQKSLTADAAAPRVIGCEFDFPNECLRCSICFELPKHQIINGQPVCDSCRRNNNFMKSL